MEIILWILGIAAVLGAAFGFFGSGGKGEDAAAGAAVGTFMAGNCLLQLLFFGAMAMLGVWLLGAIFG